MRLLFARHGESEANVRHVIANRGWAYPLTKRGRAEAVALADVVRAEGVTRIVSSPLQRATETSEIVAHVLGVPVEVAGALREFDCGVYEGRSDAEAWAAHADVLSQWFEAGRPDAHLAGGESLTDILHRFVPFIEALLASDDGRGDTVLLIGHGGTYLAALPEIIDGLDPTIARERGLDHATYIVVETGADGRLACIDWPG